jgi:hypothetical protein
MCGLERRGDRRILSLALRLQIGARGDESSRRLRPREAQRGDCKSVHTTRGLERRGDRRILSLALGLQIGARGMRGPPAGERCMATSAASRASRYPKIFRSSIAIGS